MTSHSSPVNGRPKQVDYWAARVLDGTFEPDDPYQAVATGTYVVARAAGSAASTDEPAAHEAGFAAERRRQSLWLAERLEF